MGSDRVRKEGGVTFICMVRVSFISSFNILLFFVFLFRWGSFKVCGRVGVEGGGEGEGRRKEGRGAAQREFLLRGIGWFGVVGGGGGGSKGGGLG